jgi:hypothetical protein
LLRRQYDEKFVLVNEISSIREGYFQMKKPPENVRTAFFYLIRLRGCINALQP